MMCSRTWLLLLHTLWNASFWIVNCSILALQYFCVMNHPNFINSYQLGQQLRSLCVAHLFTIWLQYDYILGRNLCCKVISQNGCSIRACKSLKNMKEQKLYAVVSCCFMYGFPGHNIAKIRCERVIEWMALHTWTIYPQQTWWSCFSASYLFVETCIIGALIPNFT